MPYRPPTFEGMIPEGTALVINSDGSVYLHGEHWGWIDLLDIDVKRKYRAAQPEFVTIRFDMVVVPEKPELDAVYNFAGEKIGYLTSEGFVRADS